MKGYLNEKQIDLENCSIYYLEGGKVSSSPTVLFIHGWAVSLEPYQESLNILSGRYHLIAPYLPGLGKSTAPAYVRNYSDYAEIIIDFLAALKLKEVHIVAHSLGGGIAIALAALKPGLVRSLIIADSTGIPMAGWMPELLLRRAIELPLEMGQMKLQPVLTILQCLLYNSLFNSKKVIQTALVVAEKDIRPFLPRIESPCLILWGKNGLITPVNFAEEIAKGIKGSKLILIDGAYHEWNFFFPEKFTALIEDFIDEVEVILPSALV